MNTPIVDVAEAIYSILSAPGYVRTIVDTRIYPGMAPAQLDADDSIIFYVSGTDDEPTLESSGDRPDKTTFTFLCLGGPMGTDGYLRARRLAKALKKQINGLIGTIDDVEIQGIERVNNEDTYSEAIKRFAVVETYEVSASYS